LLLDDQDKRSPTMDATHLPHLFRSVCNDLALAEHRRYGHQLCGELNELVIRGYKHMHSAPATSWAGMTYFLAVQFPQLVRKEWKLFWVCTLSFLIPYLILWISGRYEISWIQSILGASGMTSMSEMYGDTDTSVHLRAEYGSNFMMFCFYIWNNVRIDFQIFAGGILGGVGTIFFLVFNGIHIGASAGYVDYACSPEKFYSFVAGHSSFELIGMVIAGIAGMKMGMAVLHPGRLNRSDALIKGGKESLPFVYGAAFLTTLAAVIEGFWSAQPIAPSIKYTVGGAFWALLIAYFLFAGRRYRAT